jgi:hypothetical protein
MIVDNRSHRVYGYRRTGKKFGRLRWSGLGYIGTVHTVEDIAAMFEGETVDADVVRRILGFAIAHVFVEMVPNMGGTGYFCMIPKDTKAPRKVPEPDDPRLDDGDEDDELAQD